VNSIYLPNFQLPRHIVRQFQSPYTPSPRAVNCHVLPRHIVRQFQSPYTPSPRGLSRISAAQVALALASRFSRMLSFQIKDMEFTDSTMSGLHKYNVKTNARLVLQHYLMNKNVGRLLKHYLLSRFYKKCGIPSGYK
jgi:hypothetical protein